LTRHSAAVEKRHDIGEYLTCAGHTRHAAHRASAEIAYPDADGVLGRKTDSPVVPIVFVVPVFTAHAKGKRKELPNAGLRATGSLRMSASRKATRSSNTHENRSAPCPAGARVAAVNELNVCSSRTAPTFLALPATRTHLLTQATSLHRYKSQPVTVVGAGLEERRETRDTQTLQKGFHAQCP